MALQMPCHNFHQIFRVIGLHQFFKCPLKDLKSIGFSHFQHLFEVGILFQIFCHEVPIVRLQHNFEVAVQLQTWRVACLGIVALELLQQFASPVSEEVDH